MRFLAEFSRVPVGFPFVLNGVLYPKDHASNPLKSTTYISCEIKYLLSR